MGKAARKYGTRSPGGHCLPGAGTRRAERGQSGISVEREQTAISFHDLAKTPISKTVALCINSGK
jgi:hypothetical protein